MNLTHKSIASLLKVSEYSEPEINFLLHEFPDFSVSEFSNAVSFSHVVAQKKQEGEEITFRSQLTKDVELYQKI